MRHLAFVAVACAAATAACTAPAAAASGSSPYYGRWTVTDADQVFSAKGRLYKSFDVAPCGKDFCGVSVAANGKCGVTLFRFLGKNSRGNNTLRGHGIWGNQKKNLRIDSLQSGDGPGGRELDLNLGDGYNFNERDGSMPKFYASYNRVGEARCMTR